jgi:hypothetical protein
MFRVDVVARRLLVGWFWAGIFGAVSARFYTQIDTTKAEG